MRRWFILGLVYMLLMGLAIFHSLPNEREEERAMDYRMEEMSVMINDQRIVGYLYTPVNHEAPHASGHFFAWVWR